MRRLALAALIALAGCGDSNHPTVSARVVSAAAAKTTQAGTARVSEQITGSVNGKSLGDGSLRGAVDGSHHRADVTFDLTFLAKASGGTNPGSLEGRVVYDGDNAFVTGPAITSRLPAGRRWVRVTVDQASDPGGLAGLGTLDATRPVDHLRAVVGKTEVLGTETVNGAATKHYRSSVDYRLYLPLVARGRRAAIQKALTKLESTLNTTRLPVEVWIASDGTIRRTKGIIEGQGVKLEYTLDLSAIGKPLRIAQPPATRVLDGRKPP